jgi:hypothetical protein
MFVGNNYKRARKFLIEQAYRYGYLHVPQKICINWQPKSTSKDNFDGN